MIQGALHKWIYLGLEIDPATLSEKLRPENRDAITGMDELFAKGFGVLYWSWWLTEKAGMRDRGGLMPFVTTPDIEESVVSFQYFLLLSPYLKTAWTAALTDKTITGATNELVAVVVANINANLKQGLAPDQAGLPIPLSNVKALNATNTVLKAVLRAYTKQAIAMPRNVTDFYIPADLERMNEMLDYPAIVPGERNYHIYFHTFFLLVDRLKNKFVLDWRSEQMDRKILAHLCRMEAEGKPDLPFVAIVGSEHEVGMENFLKSNGDDHIQTSIEVPPSVGSEFEKLTKEIQDKLR